MAALRERYAGIRVEFNLVPLGRSGVVTLSPNKSVAKLARDACVNYPGCQAARTGAAIREAAAREVLRVDASGFAQLAWELDEARASAGGTLPLVVAQVGIMMIHRTSVEVLDLMARSLRNAFPAGAGAVNLAQLVAPRFHALCGPEVNTPAYDSAFWLARLGNAGASLFGGVHLMTDVNPFANRTRNYQWNYMAKAMAMPRIAALAGYDMTTWCRLTTMFSFHRTCGARSPGPPPPRLRSGVSAHTRNIHPRGEHARRHVRQPWMPGSGPHQWRRALPPMLQTWPWRAAL